MYHFSLKTCISKTILEFTLIIFRKVFPFLLASVSGYFYALHCLNIWLWPKENSEHTFSKITTFTNMKLHIISSPLSTAAFYPFSVLTLFVRRQEGHPACKSWFVDGDNLTGVLHII